jgi:hypothetical protein
MRNRLSDMLHELRIVIARERFLRWPTHENGDRFMSLLRARSKSQVARMEKAQFGSIGQGGTPRGESSPRHAARPNSQAMREAMKDG